MHEIQCYIHTKRLIFFSNFEEFHRQWTKLGEQQPKKKKPLNAKAPNADTEYRKCARNNEIKFYSILSSTSAAQLSCLTFHSLIAVAFCYYPNRLLCRRQVTLRNRFHCVASTKFTFLRTEHGAICRKFALNETKSVILM